MVNSIKRFKRRAFARTAVRVAYDAVAEEFAVLDEVLKARAASRLTPVQIAELDRRRRPNI